MLESVAHTAIRNDQQNDQAETATQEQKTHKNEEKPEMQDNVHNIKQNWRKTERNVAQQEQEIPAGTAKDVKDYTIEDIMQNPIAVLTFLRQLYATEQAKAHKQEQTRAAKAQRHQQARSCQAQTTQDARATDPGHHRDDADSGRQSAVSAVRYHPRDQDLLGLHPALSRLSECVVP